MPGRDIKTEKVYVKNRESAIAGELKAARYDFMEAEKTYKDLLREYDKIEKIHLRKVRNGELESDKERDRYELTKQNMLETRRQLDAKEKTLLMAQSAEYNYQKTRYEMMQRNRGPFARFFTWLSSLPERIADKIIDITVVSAEAKRLSKMSEKERQQEMHILLSRKKRKWRGYLQPRQKTLSLLIRKLELRIICSWGYISKIWL